MDNSDFCNRLVLQLSATSRRIEQVASVLYADRLIANVHMQSIESLFEIAQLHDSIATVLQSPDPEMACRTSSHHSVRVLAYPAIQPIAN
jgi:hypothetical protein